MTTILGISLLANIKLSDPTQQRGYVLRDWHREITITQQHNAVTVFIMNFYGDMVSVAIFSMDTLHD